MTSHLRMVAMPALLALAVLTAAAVSAQVDPEDREEFAATVAGAKLVAVVGHTRCGAIEAAVTENCNPRDAVAADCSEVRRILREVGRVIHDDDCRGLTVADTGAQQAVIDAVARRNVVRVVRKLLEGSESLPRLITEGQLGVVGMMYDVVTGEVEVLAETRHGV